MSTLEAIAAELDERLPHTWRTLYVTEGVPQITIFPVGQQWDGKITISLDDLEGYMLHLTYPKLCPVKGTAIRYYVHAIYDLRDPTSLYRLDDGLRTAGIPMAEVAPSAP